MPQWVVKYINSMNQTSVDVMHCTKHPTSLKRRYINLYYTYISIDLHIRYIDFNMYIYF